MRHLCKSFLSKKFLGGVGLCLLLVLVGFLLFIYLFFNQRLFTPVDEQNTTLVVFQINNGDSANTIGKNLKNLGLIRSAMGFRYYVKKHKIDTQFKPGNYKISKAMGLEEIIQNLIGMNQDNLVTVIEGLRLTEIAQLFERNGFDTAEEFLACVKNCKFEFNYLNEIPENNDLEGYLFPDSYAFDDDSESIEIIQKMLANFENKISDTMLVDMKRQNRSLHEVITMASLIEREVRTSKDRRLVSGILWKRLNEGISLGVDATVSYVVGDWRKKLTYQDLQIESNYNTRKYKGLPPGPICSPSLDSIKAAIYPEESMYYYYLNRTDNGETVFSKTLEEHNLNKVKFI